MSTKVQEIRILWAPSAKLRPGEGSKEDLDSLGQALPRLTRLKTFIWDAQYPIVSGLLETLQKHHPQCLLYTRHPASGNSAMTLPRLCASPCLFALNVTLTTGQIQASKELRHVLISAPKLRDLTIRIPQSLLDQLQGSFNLLHLRSLELSGVPSDSVRFPVNIAWSMLERLSIKTSLFYPDIVPQLPCLKSLRLQATSLGIWSVNRMLRSCKDLEVLDLSGRTPRGHTLEDSVWESVGKTVIALRIPEEHKGLGADEPPFSLDDMGRVIKYCRKLRSLGVNLACNGREWVCLSFTS